MNGKKILLLPVLLSGYLIKAQPASFKFDFGSGKVATGYTGIGPGSRFNYKTGYGFDQASEVESVDRGGDALTGDYITAKKPFYFSVKLPDGNYNVKLLLGDTKGSSATTVRTECRRLMLENIRTANGEITAQTFTVHLRDSLIRDGQGTIVNTISHFFMKCPLCCCLIWRAAANPHPLC